MNKKEYLIANKKWLEAKACEDAVKSLPKGVYYKVLKSAEDGEIESSSASNNKRANINSVISCHYLGRTIDGKSISPQSSATGKSHNQAYQPTPPLSLK